MIPIIDVGHGGFVNEKYTTAPRKMYKFTDKDLTAYEGLINRAIGEKLQDLLLEFGIPYFNLNIDDDNDMPLSKRVEKINKKYASNKDVYLLSIHSNTASAKGEGTGTKANGFEIWTSKGKTRSDKIADVFARQYKREMPEFRFRQDMSDGDFDKEAAFYILKNTHCPAVLVENLFYDNYQEALFLLSDQGQTKIAQCLFEAIKKLS